MHICTKHTQHTCASSNHPWRNTLFLGGVNHFFFFGRRGGGRERKRLSVVLFCCLICFETCLTRGDWLMWKAWHYLVSARGFFGKTVHSCRDRMWCAFASLILWVWCRGDLMRGGTVPSVTHISLYLQGTGHEVWEEGIELLKTQWAVDISIKWE